VTAPFSRSKRSAWRSLNWKTPDDYFGRLNKVFKFTLDPCATAANAKCPNYFDANVDGLSQSWETEGAVFMNPPYGRPIKDWVKKAYLESLKGTPVVCLLPARTDTAWWQDYCTKGIVKFIRGRLKFGDGRNSAPFPSAIVIFANLDGTVSNDVLEQVLAEAA
jgi:phage N-6-adenine-methyltransferase